MEKEIVGSVGIFYKRQKIDYLEDSFDIYYIAIFKEPVKFKLVYDLGYIVDIKYKHLKHIRNLCKFLNLKFSEYRFGKIELLDKPEYREIYKIDYSYINTLKNNDEYISLEEIADEIFNTLIENEKLDKPIEKVTKPEGELIYITSPKFV